MNPKFFDVKKQKQDAIVNAAIKVFAENGYRKASTDVIVKEAGISKGLLFHYFESKIGVYEFVYDYSIKYVMLELTQTINREETDFFAIQRMIELTKLRVMKSYPYMQQFLSSVKYETHADALKVLQASENTIDSAYEDIYKRADMTKFKRPVDLKKIIRMIGWMSDGFVKDKFRDGTPDMDQMNAEFAGYLVMLRDHFYLHGLSESSLTIDEPVPVGNISVMETMRNEAAGQDMPAIVSVADEKPRKAAQKGVPVSAAGLSFEERLALGKQSVYGQNAPGPKADKEKEKKVEAIEKALAETKTVKEEEYEEVASKEAEENTAVSEAVAVEALKVEVFKQEAVKEDDMTEAAAEPEVKEEVKAAAAEEDIAKEEAGAAAAEEYEVKEEAETAAAEASEVKEEAGAEAAAEPEVKGEAGAETAEEHEVKEETETEAVKENTEEKTGEAEWEEAGKTVEKESADEMIAEEAAEVEDKVEEQAVDEEKPLIEVTKAEEKKAEEMKVEETKAEEAAPVKKPAKEIVKKAEKKDKEKARTMDDAVTISVEMFENGFHSYGAGGDDYVTGLYATSSTVASYLPESDIDYFNRSRLDDFTYGSDARGGRGIPYDSSENIQIFVEDDEDLETDDPYADETDEDVEGAVAEDMNETETAGISADNTTDDGVEADSDGEKNTDESEDINYDDLSEKIMNNTSKQTEEQERVKELESMGPAPVLPDFSPENIKSENSIDEENSDDVHIYRPLSF